MTTPVIAPTAASFGGAEPDTGMRDYSSNSAPEIAAITSPTPGGRFRTVDVVYLVQRGAFDPANLTPVPRGEHFDVLPQSLGLTYERALAIGTAGGMTAEAPEPEIDLGSAL